MESFGNWWQGLQPLNHWFFLAAVFFSVFALWQLISAIVGLGGEADIDSTVDSPLEHHSPGDAAETLSVFKLISLRSVLAFFSLFSWAGALYLMKGESISRSLVYAFIWGLAALLLVSAMLYGMRRAVSTGNLRLESAVGANATVYLDIPASGEGEVRVLCDGVMTHLKARAATGGAMKAGTAVRITGITGPNIVVVEQSPAA